MDKACNRIYIVPSLHFSMELSGFGCLWLTFISPKHLQLFFWVNEVDNSFLEVALFSPFYINPATKSFNANTINIVFLPFTKNVSLILLFVQKNILDNLKQCSLSHLDSEFLIEIKDLGGLFG